MKTPRCLTRKKALSMWRRSHPRPWLHKVLTSLAQRAPGNWPPVQPGEHPYDGMTCLLFCSGAWRWWMDRARWLPSLSLVNLARKRLQQMFGLGWGTFLNTSLFCLSRTEARRVCQVCRASDQCWDMLTWAPEPACQNRIFRASEEKYLKRGNTGKKEKWNWPKKFH